MVQQETCAGDRQVQRRQLNVRISVVGPRVRSLQIDELDDESRSILSRAPLLQRQQETAARAKTGPYRAAGKRRAPQRRLRWERDRQKAALIVPHCLAGTDEHLPVFADQSVVPGFLDIRNEDGLGCVSRDRDGELPRRGAGQRLEAERRH